MDTSTTDCTSVGSRTLAAWGSRVGEDVDTPVCSSVGLAASDNTADRCVRSLGLTAGPIPWLAGGTQSGAAGRHS